MRIVPIIFYLLFIYQKTFSQEIVYQQFPSKSNKNNGIYLYNSYYNPIKFAIEGIPMTELHITAPGFEIRKDKGNQYYIRKLYNTALPMIKISANDTSNYYIYVYIVDKIPLPSFYFYEFKWDRIQKYQFDSIGINLYTQNSNGDYFLYTYNYMPIFKVLSFNVDVLEKGKLIYTEYIKGNRYTKSAKKVLYANVGTYLPFDLFFGTTQVRIRGVNIIDDLGNIYLLPEQTLDVKK